MNKYVPMCNCCGISVSFCPAPAPLTLYATFSGTLTIPLTWTPAVGRWVGCYDPGFGGGTPHAQYYSVDTAGFLHTGVSTVGTPCPGTPSYPFSTIYDSKSCSPIHLTYGTTTVTE